MEGSLCYQPATGCNDGTLTLPVLEYDHSLGCSVTGGHRYRGRALPLLDGTYLFGDYCSGRIWGGVQGGGGTWTASELLDTAHNIAAFGEGENGELYVVAYGSPSTLYRITDPAGEGTAGFAVPAILAPTAGEEIGVSGVTLAWGAVTGADRYDLRVLRAGGGETVFSGSLLGNGSTSTVLTLPQGAYEGAVRACAGSTSNAQCGVFGRVAFSVSLVAPSGAPVVTFPVQGATLTTSTQTLTWTAVTPNPPAIGADVRGPAAGPGGGDDGAADQRAVAGDVDDLHDGQLEPVRAEGEGMPGGVRAVVDGGDVCGDAAGGTDGDTVWDRVRRVGREQPDVQLGRGGASGRVPGTGGAGAAGGSWGRSADGGGEAGIGDDGDAAGAVGRRRRCSSRRATGTGAGGTGRRVSRRGDRTRLRRTSGRRWRGRW